MLWAERPPRPAPRVGLPRALDRSSFKLETILEGRGRLGRIRCPHCRWLPGAASLWTCMPAGSPEHFAGGCGFSWNTFDTRGVCPGCSYRWKHTMCLRCHRWAVHDDWYEPENERRP